MNLHIIEISDPLWLQTLQKLRHDIYHLPEYVYLESQRTKTIPEAILIVENEKIFFVPYLLRRCDDIFQQDLGIEDVVDIVATYRIFAITWG